MGGLKIIKASAGSGKTERLSEEYIKMLFSGDNGENAPKYAYKHILAVTFTNKATDEMKSRIVEKLYAMSLKQDDEGRRAKEILRDILRDYSSFSVSTIDKFFQSVMRAFAREVGEMTSYRVELDSTGVLDQAVDLMMSSLDSNNPGKEELLKWLTEYSKANIENGEYWDITDSLKSMAQLFLREDFKLKKRGVEDKFGDRKAISELVPKVYPEIRKYEREITNLGRRALDIINRYGLSFNELTGGDKGPLSRFKKMSEGEIAVLSETFFKLPEKTDWSKSGSDSSTKDAISSARTDGLEDAVDKAIELLSSDSTRYKEYLTAKTLSDKLYLLGIFSNLYANVREYLNENNLVLLSETTEFLLKIIDGNDTPFIYERTGARYDHYMLDEFQDTSRLQWEDFRPLLKESIDNGHSNLIVGDIKQSIYRWRGADSSLLGETVQSDFKGSSVEPDGNAGPGPNYRSAKEIIDFNNSFFSSVGKLMEDYDSSIASRVGVFYSDSSQQQMKDENGNGHVKVIFLTEKEGKKPIWKDNSLEMTGEIVDSLRNRYDLSEITFLVRFKSEGAMVASKLISLGYDVVTEDSMRIAFSPVVQKVIALLKKELDPNDDINNQMLEIQFGGAAPELMKAGVDSSLYGLCNAIINVAVPEVSQFETPFVTAFMDAVLSYTEKFGSDLAGFLSWWDDCGCDIRLSAPAGSNAIKVMTIHKAKGLKSGAIVLPFFKFDLKTQKRDTYIWCNPTVEPYSSVGLIPVKFSDDLQKTIFSDDYVKEKSEQALDALNTAYVAMTRAVGDMIIIAPKPSASKKNQNSVSDLLYSHLKSCLNTDEVFEAGVSDEDRHLDKKSEAGPRMPDFKTIPLGDRLKLSLRGGDYYDREAGIVRHDILARIDTADDLERAVDAAVNSEELAASERDAVISEMEGYIDSVAARHWFDGTYRPMNEVSIVDGDGEVFRPDRVLVEKGKPVGEGKAIIIDYKFGKEVAKYADQVKGYMKLLSDIGYTDVSGYIWYCKLNKVEECG